MKKNQPARSSQLALMGLALVVFALPLARLQAQPYSIDWFTVDGGGGADGGAYALSGTIGQPDAGLLSGGDYALSGGFWAITPAEPIGPTPLMEVQRDTPGTVLISWPAPANGWQLQQSASLNPAAWSDASLAPDVVNGREQVVVPATGGHCYYRLKKK